MPFFEHFELKGDLSLRIPTVFENRRWSPIPLIITLKNADFQEKQSLIAFRDLTADIDFVNKELLIDGEKGEIEIKKLKLPFENMESKNTFDKS